MYIMYCIVTELFSVQCAGIATGTQESLVFIYSVQNLVV